MGKHGCLHLKCVAGLQVGDDYCPEDAEQWRRCVAPTDALGVTHSADVRVTFCLWHFRAPPRRPHQMPAPVMLQPEISAGFLEKFHVVTLARQSYRANPGRMWSTSRALNTKSHPRSERTQ